jgi:hypothetical protein
MDVPLDQCTIADERTELHARAAGAPALELPVR